MKHRVLLGSLGLIVALAMPPAVDAADLKRFTLSIASRALAAESDTLVVTQGDQVELSWRSDEAVVLHLHGYDIELAVTPDAPAIMAFTVAVSGRFPISSHGFGGAHDHDETVLAYLEVYPD